MISIIPDSTKWFWPNCNCNSNGVGCAGHSSRPPGTVEYNPTNPFPVTLSSTPKPSLPWTVNKVVACSPFKKLEHEKVMKSGLALQAKKVWLEELVVVLPSEDWRFTPGMRVFIRGDQVIQEWARNTYTLDDKEFILVPETSIQVVKWPNGS